MCKIMVVDDEKKIVKMISEFMKIYQIQVIPAFSGKDALARLDDSIQLIILDINMSQLNGIETCKNIRKKSNVPILFLSANSSQADKILGLGVGADDYITKPFDPIELVARVKANIRRHSEYNKLSKEKNIIQFDDIQIHKDAYKVLKNGEELNLSSTEFKLLLYFVDNSYIALTRKQILNHVWESELYGDNTVTKYVKRLRDKLGNNTYIKSVRSVGYIFEPKYLKHIKSLPFKD
ncbi:response regulator transcription factor [Crassaminicella thermophila]|uniref:Stage 0 sporulation protein A homolog n=1 Tax=Crassaminicella thermophila TaxID=2599308 RepID=A0A5C0SAF2_CRATE|nr:response regulator transcription factor [Crassaminicella thermophila]QEK10980.1 response regulator transcription factor [Crassaminicella thermophila]